jgi:tetratricopeptide (TPR) repeat protein
MGDSANPTASSFAFLLMGDFYYRKSMVARQLNPKRSENLLKTALENYRQADTVKPGEPGIYAQIGTILWIEKQLSEAELFLRKAIDNPGPSPDGSSNPVFYQQLYRLYRSQGKSVEAGKLLDEAIQAMLGKAEEFNRLRTSH